MCEQQTESKNDSIAVTLNCSGKGGRRYLRFITPTTASTKLFNWPKFQLNSIRRVLTKIFANNFTINSEPVFQKVNIFALTQKLSTSF